MSAVLKALVVRAARGRHVAPLLELSLTIQSSDDTRLVNANEASTVDFRSVFLLFLLRAFFSHYGIFSLFSKHIVYIPKFYVGVDVRRF